jgi:acetoin utilization deacetylase AcuC-like enzyme
MKRIGFVYSEKFLAHRTPPGHAEQPERLVSLVKHLNGTGLLDSMDRLDPAPAREADILRIHTPQHLQYVRSVCERGGGMLDEGDTHASKESYAVALLAAGAVTGAVDAVLEGGLDGAFCAVRPPGHHAERDRPMGFCLFNNVAIGARYAQERHGVRNVAIIDWDVHHGNGTQHSFEDDPSVLFISLHQYPYYPGSGAREETGVGAGKGFTMNFPMPAGTEEGAYLDAFNGEIVPALRRFAPGLLMLSCGFDAHRDDPLAGIRLTEQTYAKLTRLIAGIAPVVSVLEGGYNPRATPLSAEHHLHALITG